MKYKYFNPKAVEKYKTAESETIKLADRRDGLVYVYLDDLILAINVAMATGRPLLLCGPSGCGKSSLALNVALIKNWRYYEFVVTARSEAKDILWNFDIVKRLSDANTEGIKEDIAYLQPGVLWWAINRDTAINRGDKDISSKNIPLAVDPSPIKCSNNSGAVVLIDEIDKAEVDMPNNLLVPLGSFQFIIQETGFLVQREPNTPQPLIIITNNNERELPAAFVRRCIVFELPVPDERQLIKVGEAHFGKNNTNIIRRIARIFIEKSNEIKKEFVKTPSTAEFIDTVQACLDFNVDNKDDIFEKLSELTMRKNIFTIE